MNILINKKENDLQQIIEEVKSRGFTINKPFLDISIEGLIIKLDFGYNLRDMIWEYCGGGIKQVDFTLKEFQETGVKVLKPKIGKRNLIVGDIYLNNNQFLIILEDGQFYNLKTSEEFNPDIDYKNVGRLVGNYYEFLKKKREDVFPVQLQKLLF